MNSESSEDDEDIASTEDEQEEQEEGEEEDNHINTNDDGDNNTIKSLPTKRPSLRSATAPSSSSSPTRSKSSSIHNTKETSKYYWWFRFLKALEMKDTSPEERLERWYELQLVSSDFEDACSSIVHTIITEYFLTLDNQRTIHASDE
jgi:hypothetical protein